MESRHERLPALGRLGLGTSQFGNLGRETTEQEVSNAFTAAREHGIRYFDTAPHYGLGLSERRLGEHLRTIERHDFVVSTKVGRLLVDNPNGRGTLDPEGFFVPAKYRRIWDFSASGVERSLESSLARLNLDYIDIVYLHDPDDHWEQAASDGVPALVRLRDAGVIGAIGVGMNQSAMLSEFVRRCDIDVVMCAGQYTLLNQQAATDLLPIAQERGVSVVIAGVYNSGLLSTNYPHEGTYNYAPAPADLIARAQRIARICADHGVNLPAAAIAWPLRHPAVSTVVVGCRTGSHVDDAVRRLNTDVPEALWTDLSCEGLVDLPTTT